MSPLRLGRTTYAALAVLAILVLVAGVCVSLMGVHDEACHCVCACAPHACPATAVLFGHVSISMDMQVCGTLPAETEIASSNLTDTLTHPPQS